MSTTTESTRRYFSKHPTTASSSATSTGATGPTSSRTSEKDKQPPIILVYEKAVMKEITRVVKKVMRDCHRFKVPIARKIILDQSIHKSPGWYGLTGKTEKGQFLIAFSSIIFVHFRTEVEEALRNIAAHELCHTCPKSMNHGKEWKKWVERLNEHGYRINPKPYSKKDTPGLY